MKLILYQYKCENCGTLFMAPELPGEHYGEFILRSENGFPAYLMAIDSKIFKTINNMLKKNIKLININHIDQANVLHSVFSIACDLAPDGSPYQIGRFPICPHCKLTKIASWEPTNPPVFLDEEIKSVSHASWNKLTDEEQIALIDGAVDKLIQHGKLI